MELNTRGLERLIKMIEVYIDGASAGNPGPSGAGIFIKGEGSIQRHAIPLGMMENHEAEYRAWIHALKICLDYGFQTVSFRTDSQLINQAVEKNFVKNPRYAPLFEEAMELSKGFDLWFMKWIPGSENKNADELAKKAIRMNGNYKDE